MTLAIEDGRALVLWDLHVQYFAVKACADEEGRGEENKSGKGKLGKR